MSETIKVVEGSVDYKLIEKGDKSYGVTNFKAEVEGYQQPQKCQVMDWGTATKNSDIVKAAEGSELEISEKAENGVYGLKVKLASKGGGGGRGGYRGYSGPKISVQRFLDIDKAVSLEFKKHIRERREGDWPTPGEEEELIRSRISQFWLLVTQHGLIEIKNTQE